MVDWNNRFIELSMLVASWSKDKNRGVGAIIADEENRIISVGYNGFPRGADDTIEERYERPLKYLYTEHAERNAIYSAASHGSRTKDCIIYLEWYPCCDCARAIIQAGLKKVVCGEPDFEDERWGEKFKVSAQLFKECGIEIEYR
jgi:dCMP deaminase